MTKLMLEAIEALRQLPAAQQDEVARAVLHLTDTERWLRDEVISGHAEYLADPSKAVPAEDILAHIGARPQTIAER
ncbi:protein of unknown function [Beijerinckiaceae bacterium RH AL1]|nr:hypothetical protein [Beijerinckiaceae bacterium]VVB48824.1 protein of unknown function [Beijerinckiaceae bacterium RH CH11]VVB48902.1 protein of unknown function [Beijerinckiaceae bacterium RH AL8]VVC56586.1 protein of unknown function [Beijerinckiaceae bacterium RH AL1]